MKTLVSDLFAQRASQAFDHWAATYEATAERLIGKRGYSYDSLAQTVVNELKLVHGPRLLEVGTGTGLLGRRVRQIVSGELVGIDISARMLAAAARTNRYGDLIRASGEDLPFPEASFDGVYSTFVVHSFGRKTRGFREIARVLRPGGRAFVVDLFPPVGRGRWRALLMGMVHAWRHEHGAAAVYETVGAVVDRALVAGLDVERIQPLGSAVRYPHFGLTLCKR